MCVGVGSNRHKSSLSNEKWIQENGSSALKHESLDGIPLPAGGPFLTGLISSGVAIKNEMSVFLADFLRRFSVLWVGFYHSFIENLVRWFSVLLVEFSDSFIENLVSSDKSLINWILAKWEICTACGATAPDCQQRVLWSASGQDDRDKSATSWKSFGVEW